MQTNKRRMKSGKDEYKLSGYAMGSGIRRSIEEKARSTGSFLNSFQHKIGVRTTYVLISIIWLAAFYYFAQLLLPFI